MALSPGLSFMTTTKLSAGGSSPTSTADARAVAVDLRILTTTIAGARTTYIDEGTGPVVLLLHGAPVTSLGFLRVVRELRSTHRVLAPDLPGFGGSLPPAGFAGTLDAYAEFVAAFIAKLDLQGLVMYVNDSSGCIGLAAATRLSPGTLKGLVVASTVPIPLTGMAWLVGLLLRYIVTSRVVRWLNRRFNVLPWMVATVAPWLHPFTKAERAALTGDFDTPEKRERALDLFEHMAVDESFMTTTATRASEQLADVPTLILYGQFDPMRLIGGVSRYRRMFRRHRVVIIPFEEHFGCGSFMTEEDRVKRPHFTSLSRGFGIGFGATPSA
jgi:haloalkane dehalogenase